MLPVVSRDICISIFQYCKCVGLTLTMRERHIPTLVNGPIKLIYVLENRTDTLGRGDLGLLGKKAGSVHPQ